MHVCLKNECKTNRIEIHRWMCAFPSIYFNVYLKTNAGRIKIKHLRECIYGWLKMEETLFDLKSN